MAHDKPTFRRNFRTEDALLVQDLNILRRLEGAIDLLESHTREPDRPKGAWLGDLKARTFSRAGDTPGHLPVSRGSCDYP